jgi:hypothetical protein
MDNLPELRDIHLPDQGVSFFPLAYGWWIILGAVIVAVLLVWLIIQIRKQSKKLYATYLLNKFAKENNIKSAVAMSEILRRICLKKYPEAVAFSGQNWSDFLLSKSRKKLSEKSLLLLQTAPYIKEDCDDFSAQDIIDLRKFCYDWIGENL